MISNASIGHLTNRAARLFRRLADKRLERHGLSSGYLPVLTALMETDRLSQKALTDRAGIEQPTMAATLSRMEKGGVIQRDPDPKDKRISLFSLAPAMQPKIPDLRAIIADISNEAMGGLSEDDRKAVRPVLEKLIGSLEEALGEE